MPSVSAARPGSCPGCRSASCPAGGGVVLRGHGLRERQLRGPLEPSGPAVLTVVVARRYRCKRCGTVVVVVPAEVVPGRQFTASAIAFALALFAVSRAGVDEVRRRTSPWQVVGAAAHGRWVTLGRWVKAIRAGRLFATVRASPPGWTVRQVAERAVTTLCAFAPPELPSAAIVVRAFAGAALAR